MSPNVTPTKKKRFPKLLWAIPVLLIVFFLVLNPITEAILGNQIQKELSRINGEKDYQYTITDVHVDLFTGEVAVNGVSIKASTALKERFLKGETKEKLLKEITITEIRLEGIALWRLIAQRDLRMDQVRAAQVRMNLYRPKEYYRIDGLRPEAPSKFTLDSLRVPGVERIELGRIGIDAYSVQVLELPSGDTLARYVGEDLILEHILMESSSVRDPYFRIDARGTRLTMEDHTINLKGSRYAVNLEHLQFRVKDSLLKLKGFHLQPNGGLQAVADSYANPMDVFDTYIHGLTARDLDLNGLINSGVISSSRLVLDSLDMVVYKDKRSPYDKDRRPLLLHQMLKSTPQPLHLDSVLASRSRFRYYEALPEGDTVAVAIHHIQGKAGFVTSIRDSLYSGKPLNLALKGRVEQVLPVNIDLQLPYTSEQDSLYMVGSSPGFAPFDRLNPVIYPAMRMRFTGGELNKATFSARGTPERMKGEMTLYYDDLEVAMFSKKDGDSRGTYTWLANSFMRRSNPRSNGKLTKAKIDFDRIPYKGMGNFLWKSIQSGIENSIRPFGKREKAR